MAAICLRTRFQRGSISKIFRFDPRKTHAKFHACSKKCTIHVRICLANISTWEGKVNPGALLFYLLCNNQRQALQHRINISCVLFISLICISKYMNKFVNGHQFHVWVALLRKENGTLAHLSLTSFYLPSLSFLQSFFIVV